MIEIFAPSKVLPAEARVVAVDTETSGLFVDDGARVSTVSVAWFDTEGRINSLAFPFDQGMLDKVAVVQSSLFEGEEQNLPESEWRWLLDWLNDERRLLVFHNAKFDLMMLRAGTRHWAGVDLVDRVYWDTQLGCRELWPLENTSLKPTGVRLFGEGQDDEQAQIKSWLKKHKLTMGDADKVPWEIVGPYAAKDTELTLRLWQLQAQAVEAGEADWPRLQRSLQVMKVLYSIEKRGMQFDATGCLDAAELLAARAAELRAVLPFEPTVPGAKGYFFEQCGVIPSKTTAPSKTHPNGQPSLDDEVVGRMIKDRIPWALEYQQFNKLDTALSMWYRGYPSKIGPDGRLRTNFRQTKVVSGRMSVERVQLQAIPKSDKDLEGIPGIRSFFKAKPGHTLWNLDLSQAELRVASKYADCTRMIQMLAEGADLHAITCEQVLHVFPDDPQFKYHRDIAKRLTFGSIFQIGAPTFQQTLAKQARIDLPLHTCNEIVQGWRRQYPEFGTAYRSAERAVQTRGCVRLLKGTEFETRSYFGPLDYPNRGWSRVVQGSLAEFLQLWLIAAEQICQRMGVPDALVLTVHDSLVLELPGDENDCGALAVVQSVAEWARAEGTRLFGIEMKADSGLWAK